MSEAIGVQRELRLADGRTLRVHDGGAPDRHACTMVWHHGTPQTGALLAPLLAAATRRGIRLLSYARPSYGGSTAQPGRDVASAAADVAQLADALGRRAVRGHGRVGRRPARARVRRAVAATG